MSDKYYSMEEIISLHDGQKWAFDSPYLFHLLIVAGTSTIMEPYLDDLCTPENLEYACLAHDLLEDTEAQEELIKEDVRDTIILLSRNSEDNQSRTYMEYIQAIIDSGDKLALAIKYVDNIVNHQASTISGRDSLRSKYEKSIKLLTPEMYKSFSQYDEDFGATLSYIEKYSSSLISSMCI